MVERTDAEGEYHRTSDISLKKVRPFARNEEKGEEK